MSLILNEVTRGLRLLLLASYPYGITNVLVMVVYVTHIMMTSDDTSKFTAAVLMISQKILITIYLFAINVCLYVLGYRG